MDTVSQAWQAIRRHPLRSGLSALGVALALAAVVAVLAAEQSWQGAVIQHFNELGADLIDVVTPSTPAELKGLRRRELGPEDAEAIRRQCPAVRAVGFAMVPPRGADLRAGRAHARGTLTYISPDYLRTQGWGTTTNPNLASPSPEGCWLSPFVAKELLGKDFRAQLPTQLRINGMLLPLNGIVEVPAETDWNAEGWVLLPWRPRIAAPARGVGIVARAPDVRRAAAQIDALLSARLGAKQRAHFAVGPWYEAEKAVAARRTLRFFTGITLICILAVSVLGLANSLLVNLEERVREIAFRRALGAQSRRIMAEVLVESGLICLSGGVFGALAAFGGLQLVGAWLFRPATLPFAGGAMPTDLWMPEHFVPHLSWQALTTGAAACLGAALAAGWVPASTAAGLDPSRALAVAPSRRRLVGRLLATVQVTVGVCAALLLLSLYAGLAHQSLSVWRRMASVDSIKAYNLTTTKPKATLDAREADSQFLRKTWQTICRSPSALAMLRERCRGTATVARILTANLGPVPAKRGRAIVDANPIGVEAGLANETRGDEARLARGRPISEADNAARRRVCVIGDRVARDLFGREDPLGQQIRVAGVAYAVVGVIAPFSSPTDAIRNLSPVYNATIIFPIDAAPQSVQDGGLCGLIFRLADPDKAKAAASTIQAAFRAAWPLRPDCRVQLSDTLEVYARLQGIGRDLSLRATLVGSAGLWIALVGLVNMLFASFQARTREIGLLRALGATRGAIVSSVTLEGLVISLVGGAAGIAIAWGLTTLLGRAAGVPVWIPPAWAAVVVISTVVASGLAALLPAAQAAAVNPSEALRHE
jgi:ABC-type lipoprotein release transport system permease subunit